MNQNNESYDGLMVRYFSGEASPEEIESLSLWLSSDPLNKRSFEEYRQIWLITAKDSFSSNTDLDEQWEIFKAKVKISNEQRPAEEKPAEYMPINTLNKGKVRSLNVPLMAAASLALMVLIAGVLHFTVLRTHMINVVAVNNNREVLLPDGSEIILATGSSLEYPETFKGEARKVNITGKAHFSVAHDKERPFIVSTGDVNIKVLGTQFNVNTKVSSEMMSVVLERGKVSLYFTDTRKSIILEPGERADINVVEKNIVKADNTDKNYNAWLTKTIQFENTPLSVIASTLSQTYGEEVRLNNDQPAGCTLTATFKDQSLDEVLKVIQATLDIRVIQKDNVIYLDGSCK